MAQNICKRTECLRGGKGPNGAVPFAVAVAVGAKLRMPLLRRGNAVRRAETLRIGELSPCDIIFTVLVRQFEIPGNEADFLACIGKIAVVSKRFKKASVRIP